LLLLGSAQGEPGYRLLQLDGHYVKWGAPQLGTGAGIRYAIVDRPMQFMDAVNCPAIGPIEPLLDKSAIDRARFREEVGAAAALWQTAADLTIQAVDDPKAADVLIGAQVRPTGWAFADVFRDPSADGKTARIEKALICLNPDKPWKVEFGGNAFAYDLRYTITHEFGHAIGLNHAGPEGQVMSFQYGERFRALQPGDLSGAVALYGRPGHPPAAAGTAPAAPGPELGLR
jgi:hypothetical protein